MKLYSTKEFSDEDGPMAEEFKTSYIRGTREELHELCKFFKKVEKELKEDAPFHMHFQDFAERWSKKNSIDLSLEVVE